MKNDQAFSMEDSDLQTAYGRNIVQALNDKYAERKALIDAINELADSGSNEKYYSKPVALLRGTLYDLDKEIKELENREYYY